MTSLKSPFEQAYDAIEYYFKQELNDGILSDVNTFLTSALTNEHIDAPLIWFEKEEINPSTSIVYDDGTTWDMKFNIVCCAEITDDIKSAEKDSLNLANRCLTALYKNIIKPQGVSEYIEITGFDIEKIDPNGTFEIINKTTLLPATRIPIIFHVKLNLMLYLRENGDVVDFVEPDEIYTTIFDENL